MNQVVGSWICIKWFTPEKFHAFSYALFSNNASLLINTKIERDELVLRAKCDAYLNIWHICSFSFNDYATYKYIVEESSSSSYQSCITPISPRSYMTGNVLGPLTGTTLSTQQSSLFSIRAAAKLH